MTIRIQFFLDDDPNKLVDFCGISELLKRVRGRVNIPISLLITNVIIKDPSEVKEDKVLLIGDFPDTVYDTLESAGKTVIGYVANEGLEANTKRLVKTLQETL
ncbi:MAG: hypothetical protein ABIA11_03790 [Patescibacteria group bacterium]|nr:hypothetical protein [Patescibacteria group bacterium]MBU1905719.1 hypothetical protein [Candidatus Omnitrophota bacterium]